MISKNYQRKHLRAPFKEPVLFADGEHVLKARAINISEGGLLLDEIPSFPELDDVSMLLSLPQLPSLKNFTLIKMQTFSRELFPSRVIRLQGRMVRREQLSRDLNNLFKARIGIQFTNLNEQDLRYIEEYVTTFSSNLIHLQTLIDSFNTDDETKHKVRTLAKVLGYSDTEKISQLRSVVTHDYKSLQWL